MSNFVKFEQKLQEHSHTLSDSILGTTQKGILTEFMEPLNPDVQRSALNLALLYKLAQAITISRPYVLYENMPILVNFYGLLFMPSGGGKDRILEHLDRGLMQDISAYHASRASQYAELEKSKLRKEAEEKFPNSKAGAEKYISDNSPRFILFEGSDGTLEGWYAQREALSEAGFGGTNFAHSEFGDIIGRQSESNKMLLMYLKESYDGKTKAKVIKGNKTVKPVSGVPGNLFAHSPLKSILKDDNKEALLDFLDSGLARRTFLCIETDTYKRAPLQASVDRKTTRAIARSEKDKAWVAIEPYAKSLLSVAKSSYNPLRLDDNASDALEYYKEYCQWRAESLDAIQDEGKSAELRGRFFKALKLAALLHLSDDIKGDITITSVTKAIAQTEFYARYIDNVYRANAPDVAPKVYAALRQNPDGLNRTELYTKAGISSKTFYKNEKSIIGYIQDTSMRDGFRCIQMQVDNSLVIRLEPILDIEVPISELERSFDGVSEIDPNDVPI